MADGRWRLQPPSRAEMPADFLRELEKNEKRCLSSRRSTGPTSYAVVFRLENAKSEETRKTKITQIVKMFERGEAFH